MITTYPVMEDLAGFDEIDGIRYQVVKIGVGDDAFSVSHALPLPVTVELMNDVLTELRIMNLHLSTMTGDIHSGVDIDA